SILNEERKWQDVLSGGQQQSVGFARMFLRNTDVVILDESTSSLDVASEAHMFGLIKEQKKTCLSIGHRLTLIDHHDFVLWIDGDKKTARLLPAQEYKQELSAQGALAAELAGEADEEEPSKST